MADKRKKPKKDKKKKKKKQRDTTENPDNVEKLCQSMPGNDNTFTVIAAVGDVKHKRSKKKEKKREKNSTVDNNLQSISSDVNQLINNVMEQNVAPLAEEESIIEPNVSEKKKKKSKKEKKEKAGKSENEIMTLIEVSDNCKEISATIQEEQGKVTNQKKERTKKKKKKEKRVKTEVAEIIEAELEQKNVKNMQNYDKAGLQITEEQSKKNKQKEEGKVESRQTPKEIIAIKEETQMTGSFVTESFCDNLSANTASLKTWLNSSQSSIDTDDLEENVISFKKKKKKSKTHQCALSQDNLGGVKKSNDAINAAKPTDINNLLISSEVVKLENTKMVDVALLKDVTESSHLSIHDERDGSETTLHLFERFDSPSVTVPSTSARVKVARSDVSNVVDRKSLTSSDHVSSLTKADKKLEKLARREEKRKRREEKEQRRLLKRARKEAKRLEREERRKQRNIRREEKKKRKEEKRQKREAKRQLKAEKKQLKDEKRLKREEKRLQKQEKERKKVEKEQKNVNNEEKEQIQPVEESKLNKRSVKINISNATPTTSKQTEIDLLSNSPDIEFQALVQSLNSQNNLKPSKKRKLNDIESNVLTGLSSPKIKRKKAK